MYFLGHYKVSFMKVFPFLGGSSIGGSTVVFAMESLAMICNQTFFTEQFSINTMECHDTCSTLGGGVSRGP